MPSMVALDNGVPQELEAPTVLLDTFATEGKSISDRALKATAEIVLNQPGFIFLKLALPSLQPAAASSQL